MNSSRSGSHAHAPGLAGTSTVSSAMKSRSLVSLPQGSACVTLPCALNETRASTRPDAFLLPALMHQQIAPDCSTRAFQACCGLMLTGAGNSHSLAMLRMCCKMALCAAIALADSRLRLLELFPEAFESVGSASAISFVD